MPLGLNEGGGNFVPFIKYNAKAGRWYIRDEDKNDIEVQPANVVFIADLDNLEVGWIKFGAGPGIAPDVHLAPASQTRPAQPSAEHKSGFRMRVYSEKNFGGLREWMAASTLVNKALNELYEAFEAEVGTHPGQCPVVRFTGAIPETSKHGTNYRPGFEIVQWTARPAAFDEDGDEAPQQAATPAPAQPAAAPPPPPVTPVPAASQAAGVQF